MTLEASLLAWIGLSLQEVEPGLLALVADVSGRLQVAEDGILLFVFPPALRRRLLALSGRRRLQARLQVVLRLAARLIRLSFGLVLVLVTTLVVVILPVLLIVRLFTSDDGDDVGLALLQGLAQVPVTILDLLVCGIWAPAREGSSSVTLQQLWRLLWDLPGEGADPVSLGFLSAVFSILFGDGDPNARLEPLRWRRIAAFLRLHGGVVIAEDLAPLLDLPDCPCDPDRRRDLADAAMLPVLLRFDGRPEVSEDGDLIYGFPSLPASAAGVDGPVPPLRERAFRFSRAGVGQRVAYGLAVGALLVLSPWLLAITPAWRPPVAWLARFAIGYALVLLLLPLARLPLQHWRNRAIAARNLRRQAWAQAARHADPQLKRRRAAARCLGATEAGRPEPRLVYDSGRDLLEQTIDDLGPGTRPTA
ncbi:MULTISPECIES: hypothetical protein [unclassified Cyanobium]|uniref:hypothetical protein n=1 Tax=unclassified Cyanobium TaxID=2627006 RepID=UPI0020CBC0CB|nr:MULTISPECIES: hypothetical protein [unclassified Cyanobium]MCP9861023.1 hypothetical protein [Cyanobium sp. Cruz-8H5]MCP9868252.1 hypothetical protein [Cyanobium sp. Cruz-8D1]